MDCNRMRQILAVRLRTLLQRNFLFSGKDSWAGCKKFLDGWVIYGTETQNLTTDKCTEPMYDNSGTLNSKWSADPCCNHMKRREQCCGPRAVKQTVKTVNEINQTNIALYSAATKTGSLPLDLALQFASAETTASKTCFTSFKTFWDSTKETWKVVDTCWKSVEGTWNDQAQAHVGTKCTSDTECFTGECAIPVSQGQGQTSGVKKKYCKTPMDFQNPDFATPVLTCMLSTSKAVVGEAAYKLGLPASATAAQVAAKAIAVPGMLQNECHGGMNSWNLKTKETCTKAKACNWNHGITDSKKCLNPCQGSSNGCPGFCSFPGAKWETSSQPQCKLRMSGGTHPWTACEKKMEALRKQLCGGEFTWCDKFMEQENSYRQTCMDKICGQNCAGTNNCAQMGQHECFFPNMSYDASKKAQCTSECSGSGGPNPVAPKVCIGKLYQSEATEDTCWKLASGWIESHHPHIEGWDWSRGPPPPSHCVVKSYDALNGKPYVPPPPYGHTCLPKCVDEMNKCLHNDGCWRWDDKLKMNVDQICRETFSRYQTKFDECLNNKRSSCAGMGCVRAEAECAAESKLAQDANFTSYRCADCSGQWSSWDARNLACAESLSAADCKWNNTPSATPLSQPCATGCLHQVCHSYFEDCQLGGKTKQQCDTDVKALNQCRECQLLRCDSRCATGACNATFHSKKESEDSCSGCTSSSTCNPSSSCYGNGNCKWSHVPEFGKACSSVCESAIYTCKESVMGKCWKTSAGSTKSLNDECHEEFESKYKVLFDPCMDTERAKVSGTPTNQQEYDMAKKCVTTHMPAGWKCGNCSGSWNKHALWQATVGPACIAGNTTFGNGKTMPAACKTNCKSSSCPEFPDSCNSLIDTAMECTYKTVTGATTSTKLCKKTKEEARVAVAATKSACATCPTQRCGWHCKQQNCNQITWGHEGCSGCPSSVKCHPGDSCYISHKFSGTGTPADADYKAVYDKMKQCGLATRRLEGENTPSANTQLQHQQQSKSAALGIWFRAGKLRHDAASLAAQAQGLESQIAKETSNYPKSQKLRNKLTEVYDKLSVLRSTYEGMRVQHQKELRLAADSLVDHQAHPPYRPLPGFDEDPEAAAASTARRLNTNQIQHVRVSCASGACTTESNLCTAFFSRTGAEKKAMDKVIQSFSFAKAPWNGDDQVCDRLGEICYISMADAEAAVLAAKTSNNIAAWKDDWYCPTADMSQCNNCGKCADTSATSGCDECCKCKDDVTGFNAWKKFSNNDKFQMCQMFQKSQEALKNGGSGGKDGSGGKGGYSQIGVGFNDIIFGGAGGCTHHMDRWSRIPQSCYTPQCQDDPKCQESCKPPQANASMCLSPTKMKAFAVTRSWQDGRLHTQTACTSKACSPDPWVTTEASCKKINHCRGDCAYCETASFWNYDTAKTKVKCSFVDDATEKPLSPSDCLIACGGSFTTACKYVNDTKGSAKACLTAINSATSSCSGQKTISGGTVTKARYMTLKCSHFSLSECGWAKRTFGNDMECGIQRLQCKNKIDCDESGRCDYEFWDEQALQQSGGICVAPFNISSGDPTSSGNDPYMTCMNKGGEARGYGCILKSKTTVADCATANGRFFSFAHTRAECELPGFAWTKNSTGHYAGAGTQMCCMSWQGSGDDVRCEQFTQDDTPAKCANCNGKWMSMFKFRKHATWVNGKWGQAYNWTTRAMEPKNRWVQMLSHEKLVAMWSDAVDATRVAPMKNFIKCRLNPILDSIGGLAEGKLPVPSLGDVPVLPGGEGSSGVGDYTLGFQPATVSANGSKVEVVLKLGTASAAVTSASGSNASNASVGTGRRLGLRQLATSGSLSSLSASCYTMVKNNGKFIGQLVGDCLNFNPSTPLSSSMDVCLPITTTIPISSAFTVDGIGFQALNAVTKTEYSVFAGTATRSSNNLKICTKVKDNGLYCPIRRKSDYTSASVTSESNGCPTVANIAQTVVTSAAALIASGQFSVAGLVQAGGKKPTKSSIVGGGKSLLGTGGAVTDTNAFVNSAAKTSKPTNGTQTATTDGTASKAADGRQGILGFVISVSLLVLSLVM
eukprot:TRINITY_DN25161_c0_g1_i1.p1 TRINITY_DN25161_c0_g1~~TRINITY_DN25161_c0_g1_i1.p1  ORF type:complete len:2083 (+),score=389.33 TRINITY_DN25161_c0_g1_i1:87-6251(+)